MDVKKARPRLGAALLALLLVTGGAAPARANLWSGACALRVTLSFHSAVRPPVSAPAYELEATGAADLDLTTPGIQACARTLSGTVFGSTAAGGLDACRGGPGSDRLRRCESSNSARPLARRSGV